MAKGTDIQWCDDTVNPIMGCQGCELWLRGPKIIIELEKKICEKPENEKVSVRKYLNEKLGGKDSTELAKGKADYSQELANRFSVEAEVLEKVIDSTLRCYAGQEHLRKGGSNKGFAPVFEVPTAYVGRTAKMARLPSLKGQIRPDKPWLETLPRLIFVSDMGDALSASVSEEFLIEEIITPIMSKEGQHHIWLWLTKVPHRMAAFSKSLSARQITWPKNLVAMTSITSNDQLQKQRVNSLRAVECQYRGLSIEPLWSQVDLDLTNIDWCIVGGESGTNAKPFDLAWARSIKKECGDRNVAFFVKQLGKHPVDTGNELKLKDGHGGNWSEWPTDLKIRDLPASFENLGETALKPSLHFKDTFEIAGIEIVSSGISGADSDSIEDLEQSINDSHDEVISHLSSALKAALRAGQLLLQVQAKKKYGTFLPWLEEKCPKLSRTTAYRYMILASNLPKLENCEDMKLSQAYVLTGASKPQKKPVADQAESGKIRNVDLPDGLSKGVIDFKEKWETLPVDGWSIERRDLFIKEFDAAEKQLESLREIREKLRSTEKPIENLDAISSGAIADTVVEDAVAPEEVIDANEVSKGKIDKRQKKKTR